MPRRKIEDCNVRKLLKNTGGSIQLTLPIELIRELKWRDKQKVVVKKSGSKLIIEDWTK